MSYIFIELKKKRDVCYCNVAVSIKKFNIPDKNFNAMQLCVHF